MITEAAGQSTLRAALPSRVTRRIVRPVSQSVLFRQFPLDHLDALAPVVAQAYGLNDYDARSKIRKGWGFLERDATEGGCAANRGRRRR